MMYRRRIFIGKLLINSGICWIIQLYMPWLSHYTEQYGIMMAVIPLITIVIGIVICKTAMDLPSKQAIPEENVKIPLVMTYFKMIKWVLITAVIFHVIAACVIAFFYWLNKEFEATLMITFFAGLVIGLIFGVVIPYYKNYKDNDKTNI